MSEEIEKIETKVVGIEQADKGPDSSRQVGLLLRGVDAAELKSILSGGGKLFVRSASTESEPAMTNQIEADRGEAREKAIKDAVKLLRDYRDVLPIIIEMAETMGKSEKTRHRRTQLQRVESVISALAPAAEEEK